MITCVDAFVFEVSLWKVCLCVCVFVYFCVTCVFVLSLFCGLI